MLATSPVFRRQTVLDKISWGACDHQTNVARMQNLNSVEVDAESIVRAITPPLDPSRHKGQAGKIAVIGECREYTGAPYFGADLSHVFCTKGAAAVIKSYSPELIVHPALEESYSIRGEDKKSIASKVLSEVDKWMERFDCLVIGPGLGRDPFLLACKCLNILGNLWVFCRMVFFLSQTILIFVSGYALAVLTPNVNEYKLVVQKVLSSEGYDQDAPQQLLSLAKRIGGVTILRKGKFDLISDGKTGSVAVFLSWARQHILAADSNTNLSSKNPAVLGCVAGSALMRKAASLAFLNKKRSTVTG